MGALGDGGARGIRLLLCVVHTYILLCDVRTYIRSVKNLKINLSTPVREAQMEFTYFIIPILRSKQKAPL